MAKKTGHLVVSKDEAARQMVKNGPPPGVLAAIKNTKQEPVANDAEIRKKISDSVREARGYEREIEDLQARISDLSAKVRKLYDVTIVDLMSDAKIDSIGLPAEGNNPAIDVKLKPFYSANIAASWDEERRQKGFAYLKSINADDLIKTDVVASFGRGGLEQAEKLVLQLSKKKNVNATMKEAVHSGTFAAWLKDQIENQNFTPNLELIGGSVGQTVKITERKK